MFIQVFLFFKNIYFTVGLIKSRSKEGLLIHCIWLIYLINFFNL